MPVSWNDLTLGEQCVTYNAIDEGDLSSLLYMWSSVDREDALSRGISVLREAVLSLVKRGLIDAIVPVDETSYHSYSPEELLLITERVRSWWSDDGELDDVV
jgi:hypothetical protein